MLLTRPKVIPHIRWNNFVVHLCHALNWTCSHLGLGQILTLKWMSGSCMGQPQSMGYSCPGSPILGSLCTRTFKTPRASLLSGTWGFNCALGMGLTIIWLSAGARNPTGAGVRSQFQLLYPTDNQLVGTCVLTSWCGAAWDNNLGLSCTYK